MIVFVKRGTNEIAFILKIHQHFLSVLIQIAWWLGLKNRSEVETAALSAWSQRSLTINNKGAERKRNPFCDTSWCSRCTPDLRCEMRFFNVLWIFIAANADGSFKKKKAKKSLSMK